jgi:kumamolisin
VVALLVLGLASPPVVLGDSPHAAATLGVGATSVSASFGERAGFEAWQGANTLDAVPLAHPESVDVVFRPTNRSVAIADGNSPTPVARFAASEGLSPQAYASAQAYFVREGLRVVHTWPDRLALSLEGAPSSLDGAFGTSLLAGTYHGRPVVYPANSPALPPEIESEVAGVVGLSNGYETFSLAVTPTAPLSTGASTPGATPAAGNSFMPGMARSLYGLSGLYNLSGGASFATGESIALVLWGAGYAPSDLGTFYAENYPSSFPAPTINAYPIDGAPEPSDSALAASDELAVEEMTLDLEWSGSMAPGATLDAVYASAPSTVNLTDAFEKALSLPAVSAISMSFGAPESNSGSLESAWNPLFSEAASRGITVLAATGDTGGDLNATCVGGRAPEFPASSPQVLAVGGTDVTIDRNGLGTITGFGETGWTDSGGGFSADYRAPRWQLVTSAKTAIDAAGGGRGTPDISASAENNFLYYDGADQEADGTSFATPLWAGLVAELDVHVGHPLGFFTDRLYHFIANETAGSSYDGVVDVQGGSNCVATAGAGWDAVTGWGTPRAVPLNTQLAGSFVNITLRESPSTVAPGGSMALSVVLTNWSNGAPLANTPVVLRLAGGSSVGPCAGAFESVTATSDAQGVASESLPVPACYLGSHAVASASVETDRLYGHSSLRVAVNLLGFVPSLEWLGNAPYSYLLYAGIMAAAVAAGAWIGRRRPPAPPAVAPSVLVPPPRPVAPTVARPPPAPPPVPPTPTPSGESTAPGIPPPSGPPGSAAPRS